MQQWYAQEPAEVTRALRTDPSAGLGEAEAARRLAQDGPNELIDRGMKSPWRILWEQFTATMVWILIVAAVVSALLGKVNEAVAILAIVILFGLLGLRRSTAPRRP